MFSVVMGDVLADEVAQLPLPENHEVLAALLTDALYSTCLAGAYASADCVADRLPEDHSDARAVN
jgi:hypothetical protein